MRMWTSIRLALCILLTASTLVLFQISQKERRLSTLNEGIYTCFQRVFQSYTARFLDAKSAYLSDGFIKSTEQCFAQSLNLLTAMNIDNLLEKLNGLSLEIYEFHKILARDNISNQFTNLEQKKDDLSKSIKDKISSIKKDHGSFLVLVVVLSALIFIFAFMEIIYLRKRRILKKVDIQAELENIDEEEMAKLKSSRSPRAYREMDVNQEIVNISQMFNSVIGSMAEKLAENGIKIEMNIGKTKVHARKNDLEAAISYILIDCISAYNFEVADKVISIDVKEMKDKIFVDVIGMERMDRKSELPNISKMLQGFGDAIIFAQNKIDHRQDIAEKRIRIALDKIDSHLRFIQS